MVAAHDVNCDEHGGNGGGCLPLRIVDRETEALKKRFDKLDDREGRFAAAVGEAVTAAQKAEKAAERAAVSCERIERKLFAPVNETIRKYSAPDSNPPDLLDDMGEVSRVQDPSTLYRRAKRAEKQAARQKLIGAITGALIVLTGILAGIAKAKGWTP